MPTASMSPPMQQPLPSEKVRTLSMVVDQLRAGGERRRPPPASQNIRVDASWASKPARSVPEASAMAVRAAIAGLVAAGA